MTDEREMLALYSTNCLKCSHLVETGTTAFTKCYFKSGNTLCPASEVKLVIVGKALSIARRVSKARENRDTALEARLITEVSKGSEAFRSKFYQYLENGVSE